MACPNCGSSEFEAHPASGDTYCTQCGTVLEQNAIVSEITFGEASSGAAIVQGSFINHNQTRARLFGPYRKQNSLESREVTLANGRQRIVALATSMNLPERYVDAALRFYTLAINSNFIQGRRSQYVLACCLYMVCRIEKTSHMLIDFSDKIGINLFTLGNTFLKLVNVLNVKLPLVDPSLYIARFAAMLDFGSETKQVASDAARLVQRMNRDWMVQGRRPSGLCGAALLIAAHMNNFTRSISEVVYVVKVADLTLKKRLSEFKQLPSANLSVDDFRSIILEESYDPPSYLQARKKETLKKNEDNSQVTSTNNSNSQQTDEDSENIEQNSTNSTIEEDNLKKTDEDNSKKTDDISEQISEEIKSKLRDNDLKNSARSLDEEHQMKAEAEQNKEDSDPNNFDDIVDDEEIDKILLSPADVAVKTQVWMSYNKDYLEEQKLKQERIEELKRLGQYRDPKKRKRKKPRDSTTALGTSAADSAKSVLQQKTFSRKINYDALDSLFDD